MPRHSVKEQEAFTNTVSRNNEHACHPEFISGSGNHEILNHLTASPTDTGSHKIFKILKRVRLGFASCSDSFASKPSARSAQYPRSPGLRPLSANNSPDCLPRQSANPQNDKIFGSLCKVQDDNNYNKKNVSRFTIDVSRFKVAFTLAEVLITLTIIGIVAALTLPGTIAGHQEKQTITKLKKVYSLLSQTYASALINNGYPSNWGIMNDPANATSNANYQGNKNWFDVSIKPYVKIYKNCEYRQEGCFSNTKLMSLDNKPWNPYNLDYLRHYYKFVTADGVSMMFKGSSTNCTKNWGNGVFKKSCGHVIVDIDGADKGPNTWGKDVFMFVLTEYGYYPSGLPDNLNGEDFSTAAVHGSNYTTAWVLINENMDYLKCLNQLGWDKATKCK